MPYPITIVPDLTAIGNSGAALAAGDVITGAAVHDVVVDNGIVRVTTELIADHRGSCSMYRYVDGVRVRATSTTFGDRTYWVHTIADSPTRVRVIEANDERVVFQMEWDAYSLGAGAPLIDQAYGYGYIEGTSNLKRITSCTLYKRVRVERGAEGYFVGFHTSPFTGPHTKDLPGVYSNDNSWGEREISCDGGNAAVTFSSAGVVQRHPADGAADPPWTAAVVAAVGGNRVRWMRHKDPSYSPWNQAGVIATQGDGFPGEQTEGLPWAASIHYDPAFPLCRFMIPIVRGELGAWQESAVAYGTLVSHFTHDTGDPYQMFIGAKHYIADSSSGFANEPTAHILALLDETAEGLEWPTS
jgi:hypothetical protein